jgi:hypothetical protein
MNARENPKPDKPVKRSRTNEALEVTSEYANDLRELLDNLRRKMN